MRQPPLANQTRDGIVGVNNFRIKENGRLKVGWYDGGSIFVAVSLVISVSAVSNFRQKRQFEKLSKVRNNIKVEVV